MTARSESRVVGLDVADGRLRWSRSFPAAVFVGRVGGDVAVVLGQEETSGLDPEDGAVLWTVDSKDWSTFGTIVGLEGRDGVYTIGQDITRLDTETGARTSGVRIESGSVNAFTSGAGLADGRFYVADDEELRGLDASSLDEVWSVDVGFDSFEIAAADDTVVVAGEDELVGFR